MKDNSNSIIYRGLTPDEFMKKWLILGPISIFKDDKDQGEELQKKAFAEDFLSQYGGETGIKPFADMTCNIGDKDLQWKFFDSPDDSIDLFAQMTEQPKFEVFARSETEFYWKIVMAQLTFVKDDSGKVTMAVINQEGNKIEAKKTK